MSKKLRKKSRVDMIFNAAAAAVTNADDDDDAGNDNGVYSPWFSPQFHVPLFAPLYDLSTQRQASSFNNNLLPDASFWDGMSFCCS